MSGSRADSDILALTAQIVSAHVAHNAVAASALPGLIQEVNRTLSSIESSSSPASQRPEPAVPIAKSVTPKFIICLENGKRMKMLERHLKTSSKNDAGTISRTLGSSARLPHGGAALRQAAFVLGEKDRPWHQATRAPGRGGLTP